MRKIINIVGFIVVIGAFVGIGSIISATANEQTEKEPIDSRPLISVSLIQPENHEIKLTGFGEVVPLEKTILAAQVSGEIVDWNPTFVNGGIVKRGDILFTIESSAYEADVLQAEAQVSLAEATLSEELARQQVAKQESQHLPASKVSDLYLRKPQVLSAKAQLKSAQARLSIAKRDLNKTRVVAPYDALVISRDLGLGQYVTAGTKVAELNNIETAEVILPVAGFNRPFLKQNMIGETALAIQKGQNNNVREGFIHRDLGIVDKNTRMLHLVMRIDDPYGIKTNQDSIKFGSYVEVQFAGKNLENVYKLPQTLVNNNQVWLVDENDELVSHSVEVLREEESFFYVSSGLTPDARIAENLPEYPQNGMQVRIKSDTQTLYSYSN